jgi:hypothetical protein
MEERVLPKKGFRVKVVGTYYARSQNIGKEKIVKDYEFEAVIPSMVCALNTVKNKLLVPVLKKMHKDFIMYQTYHIVEFHPLNEKAKAQMKKIEIQYMDRKTLVEFITENALPVESRLYPDLFKLRIAVQDAKTDPDNYLKKLDLRREDLEMDLELSNLNPGLHDSAETPASVSVANDSAKESAPKKDLSASGLEKKATDRVEGLNRDMMRMGEHGPMDQTLQEELDDI